MNNLNVHHDFEGNLFYAKVKGGIAELNYEWEDENTVNYKSTYVPEASRGFGVGGELVDHALQFAETQGLQVRPSCPFVEQYMENHPKYRSLKD